MLLFRIRYHTHIIMCIAIHVTHLIRNLWASHICILRIVLVVVSDIISIYVEGSVVQLSSYLPYVSHDMMDPIVTCHTYPGACQLISRPQLPSQQRQSGS